MECKYCQESGSETFLSHYYWHYTNKLVRLGKFSSSTHIISTGAPQGCVLSPLLFSLYTNDCTSKDPSVKLLKFADDTTVISLIQEGGESIYRQEFKELAVWCSLNNLKLNTLKTVEMTVDFRKNPSALPHLPSWTALWQQWSHSDSWTPLSPRTWSWTLTSTLLKNPSRDCTSFASWGSSTCHRSCWNYLKLLSLNPSSAHQ